MNLLFGTPCSADVYLLNRVSQGLVLALLIAKQSFNFYLWQFWISLLPRLYARLTSFLFESLLLLLLLCLRFFYLLVFLFSRGSADSYDPRSQPRPVEIHRHSYHRRLRRLRRRRRRRRRLLHGDSLSMTETIPAADRFRCFINSEGILFVSVSVHTLFKRCIYIYDTNYTRTRRTNFNVTPNSKRVSQIRQFKYLFWPIEADSVEFVL